MKICGIDPGSVNLGLAILDSEPEPHVIYHQYLSPDQRGGREAEDPITRWYIRLRVLLDGWEPAALIYESYIWQGQKRTTGNAPMIFMLIGAIRSLGALPHIQHLEGIRAEDWRRQLTKHEYAKDDMISTILAHRIGFNAYKMYASRSKASHVIDAAGIALVWLDSHMLYQHAKKDNIVDTSTP